MKIKRKVEMKLPQLIEYAWDNDMRNKNFESEGGAIVYFDYDGNLTCARGFVPQDFFTVTTEEEITEDTVIDNLYKMDEFYEFYSTEYKTIKDVIRHSVFKVKAVYLNDDLTMILIWRDGKLVE